MALPEVLRRLLSAPGPSGYETAPAAVFAEAAGAFAKVSTDSMGSVSALVAGSGKGPRLVVMGHVDEIGLIVTNISDEGFLHFEGVGGWDWQILVGQRLDLITREGAIPGVVGKKPIHLLEEDERKKVAALKDLHIDIGALDGDDARALVRIGDVAVISGEPVEMPNGRVISRSMDNRIGAYVSLRAAELVAESGGNVGDVIAVASAQEEIGLFGARASAFALEPDVAIAVDVTFATDAPGSDEKKLGKHPFGSGPVIGRGSTLSPAVFELLHATAEKEKIPFTVSASSGRTGTDADVLHMSRAGVPTSVVSVPLRYMHSPVEMVQLDDVENAAKLIAAFARRLKAKTSFAR